VGLRRSGGALGFSRGLGFSIPAKLTTFFLGLFFSSCARVLGLRALAKPTQDKPLPNSNECGKHSRSTRLLVRSCSRSGDALARAWSVETGISHLPSTSWMWFRGGWTYRRMVPPHRALIGFWPTCSGRSAPNGPPGRAFGELISYFVKLFCCVLSGHLLTCAPYLLLIYARDTG
jgi:hypothetical protein